MGLSFSRFVDRRKLRDEYMSGDEGKKDYV